jgi:hypothetical protein
VIVVAAVAGVCFAASTLRHAMPLWALIKPLTGPQTAQKLLTNAARRCHSSTKAQPQQRNLGHVSPVQALAQWHQKQPDLFLSDPGNLPGPDSYLAAGFGT